MSDLDNTIAFIGLGVMGYPMAVNLRSKIDSSKTLLICDVSEEALTKFEKQMDGKGPIRRVTNGFEAVQQANTVITMLPTSAVVKSVYLDPSTGILAGIASLASSSTAAGDAAAPLQKLLMECGTIETATIMSVNTATEKLQADILSSSSSSSSSKITFIDAPVSGGPMGAEAGTLTFMVGSDSSAAFSQAKTALLTHMGNPSGIFHCGGVGSGTAFKVINNYLSAVTSLAASEALNIGAKMNLDLKLLTDVINASGGQCWVTSKSNPVPGIHANAPASRDYEGGFRIELCQKVLGMGIELGEMVGARLVTARPTYEAFGEAMADERYKGKDARVVYKWLNDQ